MNAWSERYLALLDLEPPRAPSLEWLERFCSAHLHAVPFSNLTAIRRRFEAGGDSVPPLDLEALLATWEERLGGGICFEVSAMVSDLLEELGYDVHLVLGNISFPASHQAVVVRLREGPYLVDLGCGAPFMEPIPLIRTTEYHFAGLGYRFRPDLASMTCVQDRLIDGEWTEHCPYDLRPADEEVREAAYQRHHNPGETWVIGGITVVRCFQESEEVVALRDARITRYGPGAAKLTSEVTSDSDLERHAREDLRWPELPVTETAQMLRALLAGSAAQD